MRKGKRNTFELGCDRIAGRRMMMLMTKEAVLGGGARTASARANGPRGSAAKANELKALARACPVVPPKRKQGGSGPLPGAHQALRRTWQKKGVRAQFLCLSDPTVCTGCRNVSSGALQASSITFPSAAFWGRWARTNHAPCHGATPPTPFGRGSQHQAICMERLRAG